MPTMPTLVELLKAGVHFGHKTSKRHPKMEPFIYGQRNGVHIFNLEKTQVCLADAMTYVRTLVAQGKVILFVGTKKQAQEVVRQHAVACGMPYVAGRWLGGTITNFSVIRSLVQKLLTLRTQRESGELGKYTKKEQLEFTREIERLEELVGGLERLTTVPDALFIVDVKTDETAVREATRKKIPIVALCDTNVSPVGITRVIPANDDATKSIDMCTRLIAEAVMEGAKERAAAIVAAAPAASEEKPVVVAA